MTLSYAIPVCNEYKQIRYLLTYLFKNKREQDEIVVQCDKGNTTQEVYFTLQDFAHLPNFKIVEFPLNKDFEEVIKMNDSVDVFWVPRINKVKGLTLEHTQKWGWNTDQQDRINFPDYQCRIFKNIKRIKWKNKVHEQLIGHKSESQLPANDEFCLIHLKDIERQEEQNELYSKL